MRSLVGLCMLEQMNLPVPVQFKVACGTWLVCGVGWNVRTGINVTADWKFLDAAQSLRRPATRLRRMRMHRGLGSRHRAVRRYGNRRRGNRARAQRAWRRDRWPLVSPSMWCAGNRAGRRPVRETLVRQVFPRPPRTGCTTGSALPGPHRGHRGRTTRRATSGTGVRWCRCSGGWPEGTTDELIGVLSDMGAGCVADTIRAALQQLTHTSYAGALIAGVVVLVREWRAAARPSLCRSDARSELSITASAGTGFTAGGIGNG